jgi:hypothetical protein
VENEQRILDLERELKEVREAAAAEKKRLEDELVEEKRKVIEALCNLTLCPPVVRFLCL